MVDISTRNINVTLTKKDQLWRIQIFREPGDPIRIEFLRRVQEYAPNGDAVGKPLEYSFGCVVAEDVRFSSSINCPNGVLGMLQTIADDLATARGLIGDGTP